MLEIFQKVTMDVLKGRRQNVWWKVFKYLTKDLFSDIKLPFEYQEVNWLSSFSEEEQTIIGFEHFSKIQGKTELQSISIQAIHSLK